MADALEEMAVFAKVVAAGSLSAAARELGSSPALVSRRLAALEARLGVRLVNRTTRSLNLTVEGGRYYEACTRVLLDIEEADADVGARARPVCLRQLGGAAAMGAGRTRRCVEIDLGRVPRASRRIARRAVAGLRLPFRCGHLRCLSAPPLPAGQDTRIHRFSCRV